MSGIDIATVLVSDNDIVMISISAIRREMFVVIIIKVRGQVSVRVGVRDRAIFLVYA